MPDLRASDADREMIAAGLRSHHHAGRLTLEELEERLGVAFAARTQGELTRLVADLPPPDRPALAPVVARDGASVTIGGDPDTAWRLVLQLVVPALVGAGDYSVLVQDPPRSLTFERAHRPWWVWLIVVFAFPFGLLALLIRQRDRCVVSIDTPAAGRARISVSGPAREPVVRALGRLRGPAG